MTCDGSNAQICYWCPGRVLHTGATVESSRVVGSQDLQLKVLRAADKQECQGVWHNRALLHCINLAMKDYKGLALADESTASLPAEQTWGAVVAHQVLW